MATDKPILAPGAEISALLRARNALIVVQTVEEGRVKRAIADIAGNLKTPYETRVWTCTEGITDILGKEVKDKAGNAMFDKSAIAPDKVLGIVRDQKQRALWILCDFHAFLGNAMVLRQVRSLAQALPLVPAAEARAIVIVTPSEKIPPELVDHACVVKWALPDRTEIAGILDDAIKGSGLTVADAAPNGTREAAIEAAVGLSAEGASRAYSKCLVTQKKKIVPAVIAAEKKNVISARGLDWFEPDPRGLAAVGGLEHMKKWLVQRKSAFSERARAFGLPPPKGVLIVGLPGTGKSLTAKAVAAAWSVPLLRFDGGGQKGGIVGESEKNVRAAYATADAVGNCVLWFDEIEKMFGSALGALDGGVSADALGTFLSWMQEKKGGVFVVATANDVRALPPEMLRKGRFDELFFVDLPTQKEREEILRVTLLQYNREKHPIAVEEVAKACEGFTGAEIASIVPDCLYKAFEEGEREITTNDLLASAKTVVPVAKSAADKIKGLREWSKGRARPASAAETVAEETGSGRSIETE